MPNFRPVVEDSKPPSFRETSVLTPPLSPSLFDRLALNHNMSEGQHTTEQDPIESLTPEEASRIIHSHRKVRYGAYGAPQSCRIFISGPPVPSQPPVWTKWLIVHRYGMLAL
jgi:hypothetical protein